MNWKKIFAFCLIAGVVLSVAGCGNKSSDSSNTDGTTGEYVDETVYNSLGFAPTDEILNATLDDVKIQIGNTVYESGSSIKDLFNGAWDVNYSPEYDEVKADPTMLVFPGEDMDITVYPANDYSFYVSLRVENTSEENISLEDCTVADEIHVGFGGVDTEYYRENHDACVWLPGGINYKSTKDEVKDEYGDPYSQRIGNADEPANSLTYRVNLDTGKYIEYTFSFPAEGDEESLFIESALIYHN